MKILTTLKRLGAVTGILVVTTILVAIPVTLVGLIAYLLGILKDPVSFILANTAVFAAVIWIPGFSEIKDLWEEIEWGSIPHLFLMI